jgi:hypothetical protein
LPLWLSDLEGALTVVVEARDDGHALLGRVALGGPEVLLDHTVQHDEVNALVVEGVVVGPEHLVPLLTHVEIPVVLADHHAHGRLELLEDLLAESELIGSAELGQVTAEEHEVRLRIERVHVPDRLHGGCGEAVSHPAGIEVRIRDVREAKGEIRILSGGRRGTGHVHELEAVGLDDPRRSRHTRELEGHPKEVAPVAVLERLEKLPVLRRAFGERAFDLLARHVILVHGASLPTRERAW